MRTVISFHLVTGFKIDRHSSSDTHWIEIELLQSGQPPQSASLTFFGTPKVLDSFVSAVELFSKKDPSNETV